MTTARRPLIAQSTPEGVAVLRLDGVAETMAAADLAALAIGGGDAVRLVGDGSNAGLVVNLADAGVAVELGRPDVRRWSSVLAAGAISTLYEVASCLDVPRAASQGGWHAATPTVLAAYRLAAAEGHDRLRFLAAHPAGPYLAFLKGVDSEAAADVLAMILDPRYFVPARNPEKARSIVVRYFGAYSATPPLRVVADRNAVLSRAWRIAGAVPGDPAWFLARRAAISGTTAALRLFLRYLVDGWNNTILSPQIYREKIFVPGFYFNTPAEVDAFREYMKQYFVRAGYGR